MTLVCSLSIHWHTDIGSRSIPFRPPVVDNPMSSSIIVPLSLLVIPFFLWNQMGRRIDFDCLYTQRRVLSAYLIYKAGAARKESKRLEVNLSQSESFIHKTVHQDTFFLCLTSSFSLFVFFFFFKDFAGYICVVEMSTMMFFFIPAKYFFRLQ